MQESGFECLYKEILLRLFALWLRSPINDGSRFISIDGRRAIKFSMMCNDHDFAIEATEPSDHYQQSLIIPVHVLLNKNL